jgi:hypothetical protein
VSLVEAATHLNPALLVGQPNPKCRRRKGSLELDGLLASSQSILVPSLLPLGPGPVCLALGSLAAML